MSVCGVWCVVCVEGTFFQITWCAAAATRPHTPHKTRPFKTKTPQQADSPSRRELEQFLAEAETLAALHHRNIVQFYGACFETRSVFFVTELMKGGDLYSALRHHAETMRWDRLGRKVALDIALGLHYLHSQVRVACFVCA